MRYLLFLLALPALAQIHIEACSTADAGYTGGTCYTSPIALKPGSPSYLQKERYGVFSYQFPVSDGPYSVTLHFIENSTAISGPGQRVFSVAINGTAAVTNLDLAAVAPLNTPVDRTIAVTAANGTGAAISFSATVRNAVVSAIDIASATTGNTCAHLIGWNPMSDPLVFRNGLAQRPSLDYTVIGNTITPRYFADGDLMMAWNGWRELWQCAGNSASATQIQLNLDPITTPGLQHASTATGREFYLLDWPPK